MDRHARAKNLTGRPR